MKMKWYGKQQFASWCGRLFAIAGTTLVCVMVALAAGQPCDPEIPKCSGCQTGAPCGASGEIISCQSYSGYWYHCNGRADNCPVDDGYCNIWVKTQVTGFIVGCEDNIITYGFCATSYGTSFPLNRKCEGGPCIGPVADELPTLLGGMSDEFWEVPVWTGTLDPL